MLHHSKKFEWHKCYAQNNATWTDRQTDNVITIHILWMPKSFQTDTVRSVIDNRTAGKEFDRWNLKRPQPDS